MPTLKISGIYFIFIGDFNPAIFQPAWFSSEKLISETEAMAATDLVVSSQVTNFNLPWANFKITPTHFTASSLQESHFDALRDLVVSTFTLLKHTPIEHIGINFEQHYHYDDEVAWNDFGHKLAPKPIWKKFMSDPGLTSLSMVEKMPKEGNGILRVDVQSSNRIKPGIFFGINHHFVVGKKTGSASDVVKIIGLHFQNTLAESKIIAESLIAA